MKKKPVNLSYKVKGDFSPNGLQKVFLSFYPADIEQMKQVAEDIFSIANCAIYYHQDAIMEDEIDLDDYALKLQEMKMFVVIVSTNYLCNDSLAKNWEFGFAVKHNIPILPIAVEAEIENYFAIEMNRIGVGYGDIQLLRTQVKDKTEITYRQKLIRDIKSILVNDQEIEKIHRAFSGQIFLSYRKKDRKYAHELMRTIHNIHSLRNVSIWYDEFISSGENWSGRIGEAIKNSDVFLLMITPSITETDNYVIREEYPAARKYNKKIVSAKKASSSLHLVDKERLQHIFPELKIYVDGDNAEELEKALFELGEYQEDSAEQEFLIGMAFFNGIEVEKDTEKAISLIIGAAKKNLPAAINKLADMYWNGDGIVANYENSILCRKQLVELYEHNLAETKSSDEVLEYINVLEKLTSCLFDLNSFRESMKYGKKLVAFLERINTSSQTFEFYKYLGLAYDLCGKNGRRLGLFDESLKFTKKYYAFMLDRYNEDSTVINYHNLAVAYERLGDTYYSIGDYEYAIEAYQKAVEINREIDAELQSIDSAGALSESLLVLGDAHMRKHKIERAKEFYVKASALRKRILDVENSIMNRRQYGETLISRGTVLILEGNIVEAEKLFIEAKELFGCIAEECGTIEVQHIYSVVLNRCGKIRELERKYSEALEYYKESLNLRKKILLYVRTNEKIYEYAVTQYFIAEIYCQKFDSKNAKKNYEEVVSLLQPIIVKDCKGDYHQIFYAASFGRFKVDTYSGKKYLQYAIKSLKWLIENKSENKQYQKQYELCQKMYKRCYPE